MYIANKIQNTYYLPPFRENLLTSDLEPLIKGLEVASLWCISERQWSTPCT